MRRTLSALLVWGEHCLSWKYDENIAPTSSVFLAVARTWSMLSSSAEESTSSVLLDSGENTIVLLTSQW